MLIERPLRQRHSLLGGLVQRRGSLEIRFLQEASRLSGVRPDDPDNHRHGSNLLSTRLDEAGCDFVASGDPAEDVDQNCLHVRVR